VLEPTAPDISTKLDLIRAAIDRIKTAKARHIVAEQNPASSQAQRDVSRWTFEGVRSEFAQQWENVEAVLDHLTRPMTTAIGEQPDGTFVVPKVEGN
jgi:hypothetical protein